MANQTLSLPVWGEWIEVLSGIQKRCCAWSLPVWGEWIEIPSPTGNGALPCVSPRVGRVD